MLTEYEYKLNPDKTALDLIRNVQDFTKRKQIFSSIFMAVPKENYRTNFVPRKFAVVNNFSRSHGNAQLLDNDSISESLIGNHSSMQAQPLLSSSSQPRQVPTSRVSRLANFSSLTVGLGIGTIAEASRRVIGLGGQSESRSSMVLSEVIKVHIRLWQ